MYSSRLRLRGTAALFAVLQAILLISALVLGPAAAIAQEEAAAPAAESAPQPVQAVGTRPGRAASRQVHGGHGLEVSRVGARAP